VNAAERWASLDTIIWRPCETECLANFRNLRSPLARGSLVLQHDRDCKARRCESASRPSRPSAVDRLVPDQWRDRSDGVNVCQCRGLMDRVRQKSSEHRPRRLREFQNSALTPPGA
jgi:hypothetical protein